MFALTLTITLTPLFPLMSLPSLAPHSYEYLDAHPLALTSTPSPSSNPKPHLDPSSYHPTIILTITLTYPTFTVALNTSLIINLIPTPDKMAHRLIFLTLLPSPETQS